MGSPTSTEAVVVIFVDDTFSRGLLLAGNVTEDDAAAGFRAYGDWVGVCFTGAGGGFVGRCAAAFDLAEEFADLEEVGFEGVNVAAGLAVLRRRADGYATVFDDVADAKAVGGCWAKPKLAERWVAAVGCGENGCVDLIPAAVGK